MTKKRVLVAVSAMLLTIGVGAGVAAGQSDWTPTTVGPGAATMDAMHEQMRDAMPEEMRAQCDTMHAGMQGQMGTSGGTGMMGGAGGGTMGGAGGGMMGQ